MYFRHKNIFELTESPLSKKAGILKVALLLFTAFAVAACQKEDPMPQGAFPVKVVTCAAPVTSPTRTVVNNDLSISWESGEELSVVAVTSEGGTASSVLTYNGNASAASAIFEGTVEISEVPDKCYFIYPASGGSGVEINTSAGTVMFSYNNQSGAHNPFLVSGPVAFSTSGISATLNHIGGVLAITLPQRVAGITLQGNDGEKLSGYTYNYKTGAGEVEANAATSFSVEANGAGTYYINVPPVNFGKGFSLLLQGPDGTMYKSFNYTDGCNFATTLKGALVPIEVGEFTPYALTSTAVISHTYSSGTLTGSQVQISGVALQGVPSSLVTNYTAKLTNGAGTEVRSYNSTSIPTSSQIMAVSNNWPYLPQGNYTLTQTVTTIYGTTTHTGTVNVGAPTLQATVDAKTSYSYYIGDGVTKDINQANNCDNSTIYDISTEIKISSEILNNGNYSKPVLNSFKLDGGDYDAVSAGTVSGNAYRFTSLNATGQSWASHNFVASFTFDGVTVEASKKVEITGLPYVANPPKSSEWSRSGGGYWEDGYAQLSAGGGSATITKGNFHIPSEIKVNIASNFAVHNAPVGTTLSVKLGTQTLFSGSIDTAYLSYKTKEYNLNANTTMTSSNKTINIENSYGLGDTWGRVYSVIINYASF